MKKYFPKLMYASLLLVALGFTACQDEFEEVGGDTLQTIMASSTTAQLMSNTATQDGSYDNIVDGASCFAVKFPYTVEVDGIQITIDAIEDFDVIEEIYDEFEDDIDELSFLFPITITTGDFSEIVIENEQQLLELAGTCLEGGDDDDIECVDFVYPITLFTFDTNEQQTGQVEVNNDMELRQFFAGMDDDELMSIDFPIVLKKYDGTEIEVNTNAELARILEAAEDECDEDDDDDHNDDDFDREDFVEFLTKCPWELKEILRNGMDNTEQYREFIFEFVEDGTVEVTGTLGNTTSGEWSYEFAESGLQLTMTFDTNTDFNATWSVYELEEGKIKFLSDDDNRIVMYRRCDGDIAEPDPVALREILSECEWIIKKVVAQGSEIDRLLGYEFKFMAEGVVTVGNGITVSEGEWQVGLNSEQQLALLISIGDEPDLSFDWPLRDLAEERLKFDIESIGYELVLQKVCDDNAGDQDVAEIRNIMMGGPWSVANVTIDSEDITAGFDGEDFNFSTMHQVEVSINDDPQIAGVWRVLRNYDGELRFYINFENDAKYGVFTEDWKIVSVDANRIELMHDNGDGIVSIVVFEKP